MAKLLSAGIRVFVDLTEEGELLPYAELLRQEPNRSGVRVEWHRMPIPDVSIPSVSHMTRIQRTIVDAMERGDGVYVHCWGGVGRTGTVVGCCLVESGLSGREALHRLAAIWQGVEKRHRKPRTPETREQEQFVLSWRPKAGLREGAQAELGKAERFRGCLLGGAVGDALGAPVEFTSLRGIRSAFGTDGVTDFAPVYGRSGAITDDTQMTLWTAEGLLRGRGHGEEDDAAERVASVHRAYLRWLRTQGMRSLDGSFATAARLEGNGWLIKVKALHARRAPGNTCLSALASPGMGTMEQPKNDSKGCGGVMRVAPVGLHEQNPERAFDLACEAAAITHGHPTGYLAAGCLAAVIAEIMRGAELREAVAGAIEILVSRTYHGETTGCLEHALALLDGGADPVPETVERIGQGWIAEEALAISAYCALAFPDDFRRAVLLAVNHSGDSDSTGAITGNILGALLGVDAIPSEWLERQELRHEIETIATDLQQRHQDTDDWRCRYPGV